MDREIGVFDEGMVLVGAMRTLSGDVVHRDFYSPYGPGASSLLAMLFGIFGSSIAVARTYSTLIMAGIVTTTCVLLYSRTGPIVRYAFSAMCLGWMVASNFYLYPLMPCVLLALVGSGMLLVVDAQRRVRWRLMAGCCTGAIALFRYDTGFVVMVAQLAWIGLQHWRLEGGTLRGLPRVLLPFVLGVTLVFVPCAIAYLRVAPLSDFLHDIIDYPLRYYARMRAVPFPGVRELLQRPDHVGVYMPFATLLLALAAFAFAVRRRDALSKPVASARNPTHAGDSGFLLLFSLIAAAGCYKSAVRVSNIHMMLAIIPAGLVLAVLVDRAWAMGGRARVFAVVAFMTGFVPAGLAGGAVLTRLALHPERIVAGHILGLQGRDIAGMDATCVSPPPIRGATMPPHYMAASRYLLRYSRPDERIFVGLTRHDRLLANAVALYFASARLPGTHWHQFDPGLQTRVDVQKEMINDLQRNRVRWVVVDSSFQDEMEFNGSHDSSGVHLLDDWLATNYRPVALMPPVEIWLENSVVAPVAVDDPCLPKSAPSTDQLRVSAEPRT